MKFTTPASLLLLAMGAEGALRAADNVNVNVQKSVQQLLGEYKSTYNQLHRERRRLQPGGGGPGGDGPGGDGPDDGTGTGGCAFEDLPCACNTLGTIATTTASGSSPTSQEGIQDHTPGEDIYGPFEAGFSETQKDILILLGCTDDNVANAYVDAGLDTRLASDIINEGCDLYGTDIEIPYVNSDDEWIGMLDGCGGHTDYHFHEDMSCLYDGDAEGHSTQVGQGSDGQYIYGRFEDTDELPLLDACGGHFGITPDSDGEIVYHYHTQEEAPFTFGCYGPNVDEEYQRLVSVEECRALYEDCDGETNDYQTGNRGVVTYDNYCPCFDAQGKNYGDIDPLPAVANATTLYGPLTSILEASLSDATDTTTTSLAETTSATVSALLAAVAVLCALP